MNSNVKIDRYGTKSWYQDGKWHRLDGPAVEYANGDKEWYQEGKLHRLDGPAIEWANGDKYWYQDGKRHRLDGPAVERFNGALMAQKFNLCDKEWWQNGKRYGSKEEWFQALSQENKLKMLWEFGWI